MAGPMIRWVCTKCGRSTNSQRKPGTNGIGYPSCPKSSSGTHSWTKG